MYHDMNGWGWFGMTFGAAVWIVLLALAVYVAVRLANRHDQHQ